MSADLATLNLRVNANGVEAAEAAIRRVKDTGDKAAASLAKMVGVMAGLAAATAFLAKGAQQAMAFEKAMAAVGTVLSDRTQLKAMTDQVKELTEQFDKSPVDQAKALYDIVSAGASDAATAMEILTTANKLAVGGVTEVGVAADGLTSIMNGYGSEVKSATEVADKMFISAAVGKTTIEELSHHLGVVVPTARAAGVSLSELLSAVGALTKVGIATPQAITGIRSLLNQVMGHSVEASKLAKQLGFDYSVANLKAKGLAGFLDEMKSKTGGSAEMMKKLVNDVEGFTTALALTGNASNDYKDAMKQMENSTGKTEEAFQQMANTGDFSMGKLTQQIQGALMPMFEGLASEAGKLGKAMSDAFGDPVISDVIKQNTAIMGRNMAGMATDAASFATNIASAGSELSGLEIVFGTITLVVTVIRDLLNNVYGVVQVMVGAIGGMVSGLITAILKLRSLLPGDSTEPQWLKDWQAGSAAMNREGGSRLGMNYTAQFYSPGGVDGGAETLHASSLNKAARDAKAAAEVAKKQAEEQRKSQQASAKSTEEAKKAADEVKRQIEFVGDLQGELNKLTGTEAELLQIRIKQAALSPEREREAKSLAALITLKKGQAEAEREITEGLKESARTMEQIMALKPGTTQTYKQFTDLQDWEWTRGLSSRYGDPKKAAMGELNTLKANRDALDPDTYTRAFRALKAEASDTWYTIEYGAQDASRTMADAFASWTTGAKVSVRDMTKDILANLARIAANRTFATLMDMGLQALGSYLNTTTTTTNYQSPDLQPLPVPGPVGPLPTPNYGPNAGVGAISVVVNMPANGGSPQVTAESAGRMGGNVGNVIRSLIADETRPGGVIHEALRAR